MKNSQQHLGNEAIVTLRKNINLVPRLLSYSHTMLYCWWLRSAVCKCHTPTDMRLQRSDIGHETSDMRHRTTDNGQWVWSQIVDKMFDSSFRVVVFVVWSWDSSLFYVATELESLLLRARQITVAVSVDDRSLQKRLFEFTGCWGRPVIDVPQEMLELYLEHHFTPVQIAQLFSVSSKAIRKRLEEA